MKDTCTMPECPAGEREARVHEEGPVICRMHARHEHFFDLIEALPDAMVLVGREGKIIRINAQLTRLFGYTEEETVGKDIEMLLPARFHARHRDHVREFMARPRILVANAIEAMAGGGTLTVNTKREREGGAVYAVVSVKDTGKGIEPEVRERIFEPFFSTKVAEKGTGLGLSITKKIVEDHGGFIRVESAAGEGSTFFLYFPARNQR